MTTLNARWRFADEAPRIGTGERGVDIQVGRKWVRFTERSSGRRQKIRREMYELLKDYRLMSIKQRAARPMTAGPKSMSEVDG